MSAGKQRLIGLVALVKTLLLASAFVYWRASRGPHSARARYRRQARAALEEKGSSGTGMGEVITDADLAPLPAPVAAYLRRSGAIGQPHVVNFHARIHGRIRGGPDKPWMPFTGEQTNTYGPLPGRLFFIDARMFGLPVDVLHAFVGPSATMEVKACSLVTMVDASGPEMDRSETVTVLNDLCVLAPAALVDADITWETVDERHVLATFTRGAETVTAELVFDGEGRLVDFISDDRLRSSADGRTFTGQRWSTPLGDPRRFGPWRLTGLGEARWHAPEPEGEFAYLEFHLDDIAYNVS